uniref:Arginase n=1 Tax=Lepeophtheirus salmonis TaxID=72036 RepID=A0A0K2UCS0_LEPSM
MSAIVNKVLKSSNILLIPRGIRSRCLASSWNKNSIVQCNVDGSKSLRIGVLGASFEMGQPKSGVAKSPDILIKEMNMIKQLEDMGHNVDFKGILKHDPVQEIEGKGMALNRENVHAYNLKLKNEVSNILKDNRFCLVIGGDHSIGIGTVSGFTNVHPNGCLLWVDAHSDINTPDTSDSGNMHGMPVAYQISELYDSFKDKCSVCDWHEPRLSPDRIAFIGLRSVDPGEVKTLKDLNIEAYYMNDIDELGINEVIRRSLRKINPNNDRPLHVSFDIDSLDPSEAPTTGTPVRGGLTLREGFRILYECHKSGCLTALDMVEVNTYLGNEKESIKTLTSAEQLILSAFGQLVR